MTVTHKTTFLLKSRRINDASSQYVRAYVFVKDKHDELNRISYQLPYVLQVRHTERTDAEQTPSVS